MSLGKISIIKQRNPVNTGTVIFLHGSGDIGENIKSSIQLLRREKSAFSHLKILFPTAPLQPYTYLSGQYSNVWFDRLGLSPEVPECLDSIGEAAKNVTKIIDAEIAAGIPKNKIIIGGFSMGGSMSLYMGYKYSKGLAGVFALSSFMNNNSILYQDLEKTANDEKPPLFFCHGVQDELVPFEHAQETFNTLQKLGVQGQFHEIKNAMHEITSYELNMLYEWINERIPPPPSS